MFSLVNIVYKQQQVISWQSKGSPNATHPQTTPYQIWYTSCLNNWYVIYAYARWWQLKIMYTYNVTNEKITKCIGKYTIPGWWQLNYFLCSPRTLGKMNPFWRTIFHMGWFNHQLDICCNLEQPPNRENVFSWQVMADSYFARELEERKNHGPTVCDLVVDENLCQKKRHTPEQYY